MSKTKFNERLMQRNGYYTWIGTYDFFGKTLARELSPIFDNLESAERYCTEDQFSNYLGIKQKSRLEECGYKVIPMPEDRYDPKHNNDEIREDDLKVVELLNKAIDDDKKILRRLKQIYE